MPNQPLDQGSPYSIFKLRGLGLNPQYLRGAPVLGNRQNPHTGSLTCGVRLIMENQVEVTRTACTQENVHGDQYHMPRGTAEISATIEDLRDAAVLSPHLCSTLILCRRQAQVT